MYRNHLWKRVSIFFLGLLMVVLSGGCGLLPQEEEKLRPPLIKPKAEEYNLYKVVKKDITKTVKGTGTLVAINDKSVSFSKSGMRLDSIEVKLGDKVGKGTTLAKADTGDIQNQISIQQLNIKQQEIDLQYKQNKYNNAKSDTKANPNIDLEQLQADIQKAKIELKKSNLVLNNLQNQYANCIITSPIDGVVTFADTLKQGDQIEAYKTIVTVSDPQALQIYYQNDSVKDVKGGMTVNITYNGKAYTGRVMICPDNVPADKTDKYQNAILISLDKIPEDAKMGDSIDIEIAIQSKKDTIVIPKSGLTNFMGENTVQTYDGASKKEVNVQVGIESDTEVEIQSGLQEGQSVILR